MPSSDTTPDNVKIEYNVGGGGDDFEVRNGQGAPTPIFWLDSSGSIHTASNDDTTLVHDSGPLVLRRTTAGSPVEFRGSGLAKVSVTAGGVLRMDHDAKGGPVYNVLGSNPTSPEEGLTCIVQSGSDYYFRAYINGAWRDQQFA